MKWLIIVLVCLTSLALPIFFWESFPPELVNALVSISDLIVLGTLIVGGLLVAAFRGVPWRIVQWLGIIGFLLLVMFSWETITSGFVNPLDTEETNFGVSGTATALKVLAGILSVLAGTIVGLIALLLISPLYKDTFLHKPHKKDQLGLFVQAEDGQAIAIDYGGNYFYTIFGGIPDPESNKESEKRKGPVKSDALLGLWMLYKMYIWWTIKVHVYVPYFTEPKTYPLPRYLIEEKQGKREYLTVDPDNPSYYTNHVRTAPFTWYMEVAGAEIQTIPFTVKGSVQVRIDETKVRDALYLTQSWNILLNQALNSVTRAVVRSEVTIDDVIGEVKKELWDNDKTRSTESLSFRVADSIFDKVKKYKFDNRDAEAVGAEADEFAGLGLEDFGIIIYRVDITDFEDELSPQEREQIRQAFYGRQLGRRRDLEGQGIAAGEGHLLAVHKDGGDSDLSKTILDTRALVDASEKGKVEALLVGILQQLRKGS